MLCCLWCMPISAYLFNAVIWMSDNVFASRLLNRQFVQYKTNLVTLYLNPVSITFIKLYKVSIMHRSESVLLFINRHDCTHKSLTHNYYYESLYGAHMGPLRALTHWWIISIWHKEKVSSVPFSRGKRSFIMYYYSKL